MTGTRGRVAQGKRDQCWKIRQSVDIKTRHQQTIPPKTMKCEMLQCLNISQYQHQCTICWDESKKLQKCQTFRAKEYFWACFFFFWYIRKNSKMKLKIKVPIFSRSSSVTPYLQGISKNWHHNKLQSHWNFTIYNILVCCQHDNNISHVNNISN